jgi:hypothetical protein
LKDELILESNEQNIPALFISNLAIREDHPQIPLLQDKYKELINHAQNIKELVSRIPEEAA